jgi:lipopolysaccharide assembly outer membrane protein LptD (OstA)
MIRAYATAGSAERITISSLGKIVVSTVFLVGAAAQCFAQTSIPLPERKALFAEDRKNAKRAEKRALKSVLARDAVANKDMDLRAPRIEYSKDGKTIQGAGGVSLKSGNLSIESDQIAVQTETKDASFSGAVTVNSPQAKIIAASGATNLDSEAGTFNCGKVRFEESNYQARAGTIKKLDDERFEFQDARFTTCSCPGEGSGSTDTCNESNVPPWSINADSISMTRDGYAFAKWASLRLGGVPIFYSPWLGFPTKEERQSGLLAPTFGYSSNDGFKAEIPLFVTLGQTADATLTPFIETKSRVGLSVGYRQKFSRYNQLNSKFYLSDESARDGSLRGTNVSGLFDPTFDENRTGALLEHYWRSEKESGVDLTYIADVRYVSDDLF